MRSKQWVYVAPILVGVALFVATRAIESTWGDSEPQGTPAPGLGVRPDLDEVDDGEWFSLSEPIPTSMEHEISGKKFVIPEGSTMVLVSGGMPIVDEKTGESLFTLPEHDSFWFIQKGKTEIRIDSESGEVFDAKIDPADRDAFSQIIEASD
jgi:hypothetical protein